LTYLDYPSLERKGADIKTKMDTFEKENKLLREEQKMNDDRLAIVEEQFSIMQSILSEIGSMGESARNQFAKKMVQKGVYKKHTDN
jgi:hypothetical protein